MTMRVGFIGLGNMGMPIVLRMLDAGQSVTVWGRSVEKLRPALVRGAEAAPNARVVADKSDAIFLCVTDTSAVEAVVFGADGVAEGGAFADTNSYALADVYVGWTPDCGAGAFFEGYLDDVRVTRSALWTAGFTPPARDTAPGSYFGGELADACSASDPALFGCSGRFSAS